MNTSNHLPKKTYKISLIPIDTYNFFFKYNKTHTNLQAAYTISKSILLNTTDFCTCSRYARGWDYYIINQLVSGYHWLAFLNLVSIVHYT